MNIKCTISPRISLEVCAPQRVPPAAIDVSASVIGASSVAAAAVCVRAGHANCLGASTVEARGSAIRGGRAGIVGGSVVTAAARVRHDMEEIKRIFGEESIQALFSCDENGDLKDYSPPRWPSVTDYVGNVGIAPISDSFSTSAMDILNATGVREYQNGPLLKTFSLGVFMNSRGVNTTPIALTNNTSIYLATSGRMMIRNAVEGQNNYSPTGFVNYDQNEFMVWSADEVAGKMYLQATGGTHIINSYPSDMTEDRFRFVHQSNGGGEPYTAQFWIVLDRLMTDPEIAAVRALL